MTIHFHCICGQKLKASDASIGKQFDCPVCGAKVTVPETDEAPDAAAAAKTVNKKKANSNVKKRHARPQSDDPSGVLISDTHEFEMNSGQDEGADTALVESDTKVLANGDTAIHDAVKKDEPRTPKQSVKKRTSPREAADEKPEHLQESDRTPEPDRPAEVAFRRNYAAVTEEAEAPGGTAAETARDLYKLVRQMKKDGKAEAQEQKAVKKRSKKKSDDAESLELGALLSEMLRVGLPGTIGIGLLCALGYWVASTMMSVGRGWPELGSVYGQVTLDGAPLEGATVTFSPVPEQGVDLSRVSSSVGLTDAQGRYELMYVADAAGAAVGKHTVTISARLPNGKERIPMKYNAGTTLGYEVKPGSNTANWPLESSSKRK